MLSVFCSVQWNRLGDQEDGLKLLMGLEVHLNSNISGISAAQEGKLQSHFSIVFFLFFFSWLCNVVYLPSVIQEQFQIRKEVKEWRCYCGGL